MRPVVLVVCCQLLAFWPTIRWYVTRSLDPSTGGWGLVALATAGCFLSQARPAPTRPVPWCGLGGLTLLYAGLQGRVPPLVSAIVAVMAMAWTISTLRLGRRLHPGFVGLLLLALPVVPTIQFFLGYPLRLLTAEGSVWFLRACRIPVVRQGTLLRWAGELVVIDAPCSGVHMLWTGMFLAAAIACFHELRWLPAVAFAAWAGLLILLTNALRSGLLFLTETGLWPSFPGLHSGIGLAVFALMAFLLVGGFHLGWRAGEKRT